MYISSNDAANFRNMLRNRIQEMIDESDSILFVRRYRALKLSICAPVKE